MCVCIFLRVSPALFVRAYFRVYDGALHCLLFSSPFPPLVFPSNAFLRAFSIFRAQPPPLHFLFVKHHFWSPPLSLTKTISVRYQLRWYNFFRPITFSCIVSFYIAYSFFFIIIYRPKNWDQIFSHQLYVIYSIFMCIYI